MHRPRRALPALLALVAGLVLAAPAAAAPRTVIFNMYPSPLEQPDRVFFQANSGPFLDALRWTGWGTAEAVGTGTWRLDCSQGGASCAPGDPSLAYPARYTLRDLAPCPRFGRDATTYRSGAVVIDEPNGPRTVDFPSDYDFCAKRPTRKAGVTAVRRYVERRLHGERVTASCKARDAVGLECSARWWRKATRRQGTFDVSATMRGRLLVQRLGA